jgi:DNA-binding transcriptional regulator YiaG
MSRNSLAQVTGCVPAPLPTKQQLGSKLTGYCFMFAAVTTNLPRADARELQDLVQSTGSIGYRQPAHAVRKQASRNLSVDHRLGVIRSTFGLSVSQLAKILRVTRPTIYAWTEREATPRVNSLTRLEVVSDLAAFWAARSDRPIGSGFRDLAKGRVLMKLLSARTIDCEAVQGTLLSIVETVRAAHRSRTALYDRARAMGLADDKVTQLRLDDLTGKRSAEE